MGRPRGSIDLHGRARRVRSEVVSVYLAKLALRVRDARLERGIAAAELAAAAGVHPRTLFAIEAGRGSARRTVFRTPSMATLIALALALDLSPSELMP